MEIQDKGDAFDMAWGLYSWLSHNHCGQGSEEYSAMCKISGEYELTNIPDIDFDNNDCDEHENAVYIYNDLDDSNWQETFEEFCDFMDNKWDDSE